MDGDGSTFGRIVETDGSLFVSTSLDIFIRFIGTDANAEDSPNEMPVDLVSLSGAVSGRFFETLLFGVTKMTFCD